MRFVDKYMGRRIQGWPVEVVPMFSTQLATVDSGSEVANRRWMDPLREISIPQGVRDHPTFETLKLQWMVMGGPAQTWPWRDPTDFASVELTEPNEVPVTSLTDQPLGIGDGFTTRFQLTKRYDLGSPSTPYDREIRFPVVNTIEIGVDGLAPGDYSPPLTATVTRYGGYVDFNTAPPANAVLTWGGLFDIQVRFQSDDTFRGIMRTVAVSGFGDIPLQEVRFCED